MTNFVDYLSESRIEMQDGSIIATDSNIKKIVESEIKRLGNNADLNHIDVSNVKNMSGMFEYSKFNGDISNWNVSNVKDMSEMFYGSEFNGDISKWNVSNVRDMSFMFDNSPLENNPPKWYKQ